MKKTILYNNHIKLKANMIIFSGYHMPQQYISSIKEHLAVRHAVGIFDISHMGKIILQGNNVKRFIQYLTTNNILLIKSYQAQYSCIINYQGGIIDDLIIYQISDNKLLLIVNAINTEKNKKWINYHIKLYNLNNISLLDITDKYSIISIQGPKSINTIQKITNISLDQMPFYHFQIGSLAGIKNILISRTGYTGAVGFEIYIPNQYSNFIWNEILDIGHRFNIHPCGLSSRDSLRLEMGYRLYGNELSEKITPIEAGLSWITKFNKQFISRDLLKKQQTEGQHKRLIAFLINNEKKGFIPRNGHILKNNNNITIGTVTSGCYSPMLKKGIGLGFIENINFITSNSINYFIYINNRNIPIKIVKLPFIKV
ncbi:glycine cleavage system aminomethyltransferase GcvT [Blattabacterium cuenoti]|uniref:glycine cleavage system aminomethyltransferase GcvT n=1 Tax=Blattabacterium cuenoti TaxID=1653831 RepID=UPI001EEA5E27|nr:glycine cleavage system aminomethyltransferase GcvT [Blattabacterium cuenoti]